MNSSLTIIPIAAGAFIATNLDNLILLVSLLARYQQQIPNVIAGYFLCVLILGAMGFAIGAAANLAPVEYLGLLGIAPITIGTIELIRMRQHGVGVIVSEDKSNETMRDAFTATLFIQLANGVDTVVTFGALFTDSTRAVDMLIVFTIAAMAVTFVFVALSALRHPVFGEIMERYAYRVTPFILIAVGAYILVNTATDLMPG